MGQDMGQRSPTEQVLLQNIETKHSTFGVQNLSCINKEKSSKNVGIMRQLQIELAAKEAH